MTEFLNELDATICNLAVVMTQFWVAVPISMLLFGVIHALTKERVR